MQLRCPHCTTVLNVESPAGTQVACPSCSGEFMVPEMQAPVTNAAESSPAEETEEEEKPAREIPWKKLEKIGYTVLFSIISGALIFIVIAFVMSSIGPKDEVEEEVVYNEDPNATSRIQDIMEADEKGEINVNFMDAKKSAAYKDGFKVKVSNVEWGEVRGRDATNSLVTSERPYILVFFEIANRSDKPISFKSWYGNLFDTPAGPRTAQLSDDSKAIYYPMKFEDIKTIQGHTPAKEFEPGEEDTDAIVFDVPDDFNPAKVENLYLDLPGQAIKTGGSFRFRIPNSMIQGL